MDQDDSSPPTRAESAPYTLTVDRLLLPLPKRTAQSWGMSGPELNRLFSAMHWKRRHRPRRSALWWLSTDRGTSRSTIADIGKRITRLQRQYDLPGYSLTTFETGGGIHAHIVFVGNSDIAEHLNASVFGSIIDIKPVTDPIGLVRYLAKERTPQAGHTRNHLLGGRIRGSHRLAGGGDRVRLSKQLEADLFAAGKITPWQRTNAKRNPHTERKLYRPRRLTRRTLRPAGQLPLLPELNRPVSRLRSFAGGFIPPSVAREMEFKRQQLGLSQVEYASRLGISQSQYSNAIRGHDPISTFAINRARELSGRSA